MVELESENSRLVPRMVCVRMSEEQYEALKRESGIEHRSTSGLVRMILVKYLEDKEEHERKG